jgi:hypothetical protein
LGTSAPLHAALDELACWPEGDPAQARSTTAHHRYCWVVWKHDQVERTSFAWLRTKRFKSPIVELQARCALWLCRAKGLLGVCCEDQADF